MHRPQLLLLDEPTAGVDPKARREFWDEIHRLAADGLTVLVSTHYMDEAERCHRIVYIAYGTIVAGGTAEEIIEESGLATFVVTGRAAPARRRARCDGMPGVEQVAAFGAGTPRRRLRPRTRSEASVRDVAGALRRRGGARRDDAGGRLHPPDERGAGAGRRLMSRLRPPRRASAPSS